MKKCYFYVVKSAFDYSDSTALPVERHPLEPFLPAGARVLMLGSFPPPHTRWCMEFYYPNFMNDMWRIAGLVFYGDKLHFVDETHRRFDCERIVGFCRERGIAIFDTATAVRRLRDNASDKFLEVVEPTDVAALLRRIPECRTVAVTGEKAAETVLLSLGGHADRYPKVGEFAEFVFEGRPMRLWRMPSSSRAYPLAVEQKAAHYARMFADAGVMQEQ